MFTQQARPGSLTRLLPAAALLVALETGTTSAADNDATGITSCDIGAWSTDKDPAGLNIRAGPGTDSPIIGNIPPPVELDGDLFASEVSITGSRDGWFRISSAFFIDYYSDAETTNHFEEEGWVSGRFLGFSVEGRHLRNGPWHSAPPVVDFHEESRGQGGADFFIVDRIHACQGFWVEVEGTFHGKRLRGWTNDTCSSQVTTCP